MKHDGPDDTTRRALLVALGLFAVAGARASPAIHDDEPGAVRPPRPVPDIAIALEDGRSTTLRALLMGRVTALQFVLTGCSSTCPVLGAIFGSIQQQLTADRSRDLQLVSLSLDPLGDTPEGLARWKRRFGAGPDWRAVVPKIDQSALVETLLSLGVSGTTIRDQHTSSVLVIDRQARLIYRSESFPDSGYLLKTLTRLAA